MSQSASYLNALRAFEAAARHESFAKAADELCVSHSVVSRHIRNLELWLETALFVRTGNRVMLTDEARMFAPRISEAFQTIQESCERFRAGPRKKTIRVSAEPAFATRWLRRRTADFYSKFPNIEIDLKSAWSPPSLESGTADVVIHFDSRVRSKKWSQDRLFPIDAFPACAPDFLPKLPNSGQAAAIEKSPLIHDNGRAIWRQWFETYAPRSDNWRNGRVYSDLSLAIDAAVDGEGVFLADEIICAREMERGALVSLDDRMLRCTWYSATYRDADALSPALAAFRSWLLEAARKALSASTRPA